MLKKLGSELLEESKLKKKRRIQFFHWKRVNSRETGSEHKKIVAM